jgi:hypothetical protein
MILKVFMRLWKHVQGLYHILNFSQFHFRFYKNGNEEKRAEKVVSRKFFFFLNISFSFEKYKYCIAEATVTGYSRITSTKFPSFYMATFSASLTTLTFILLQWRDCSCYVSSRILASPQICLQKHTIFRALSRLVTSAWGRLRYVPLKLETLWD